MVHSDTSLSPCRGSAETPFHPDSESQEDREGPQLTSSNGRSQVRPAAAFYLGLPGARHETTPQAPGPLRRGEEARRQQKGHDVEPDVACGDAARWIAV